MEKQQKIQVLKDMIQIKSVNGGEEAVADYLKSLLASYGIESKKIMYAPGRSNLVVELGNSKEKVLGFTGHMDVVDAGDESRWTYPPFEGVEKDGKIHGRGATDMKGGLAAMIIALIELKEEKVDLGGTLKLLVTVGEEIGELGAEQLTTEGYADNLDALVVGEPSNYNLCYAHMGSMNYTVTSFGKEAHSSMPQLGINAINHLLGFMDAVNQRMDEISESYMDEELGRTIHNITVISGGNQVNSIPAECKIQGNIRTIPEFGNDKIEAEMKKIIDELNKKEGCHLELVLDFNKLPVKAKRDSKLIQDIQKVYDKKIGGQMPLITSAGTTDTAEFIKGKKAFDFVIFGPGEPSLPHKVNEYVEVENYLNMIDIYKEVAKEYLKK